MAYVKKIKQQMKKGIDTIPTVKQPIGMNNPDIPPSKTFLGLASKTVMWSLYTIIFDAF
jgi:hypothetical protein